VAAADGYTGRMTASPPRARLGATPLIVLAAIAVAIGFFLGSRLLSSPASTATKTALMYPAPRTIADFHLTQANGQPLAAADWRGHWTVAFFGFTHCPDICPNTLAVFKQVWNTLDADLRKDRVRFDFISVDPQRDTPEQLGRYVSFFHPDFRAATGSDEQLTALTRSLGLIYARTPGEGADYSVDHSASVVIIDPEGHLVGLFRPPFEAAPIAADLATLAGAR
jgi:protein SCO1/2